MVRVSALELHTAFLTTRTENSRRFWSCKIGLCFMKDLNQLLKILSYGNFGLWPIGRLKGIFIVINLN